MIIITILRRVSSIWYMAHSEPYACLCQQFYLNFKTTQIKKLRKYLSIALNSIGQNHNHSLVK